MAIEDELGEALGTAPAEPMEDEADDLDLVAEELIAAIKAGDAAAVASALRSAHEICSTYSEPAPME